jgi:hypothetical protein
LVCRSKITVETETRQGEALWIEWEDLSKQQQDVELIAVSKVRCTTIKGHGGSIAFSWMLGGGSQLGG